MNDLWWFLGIMLVLGALWLAAGGADRPEPPQITLSPIAVNIPEGYEMNSTGGDTGAAIYGGGSRNKKVEISQGSAAATYIPGEEYIILTANRSNSSPIAITGWQLENGRGEKMRINGGKFSSQNSARATIPNGVLFFEPSGKNVQTPIVLNPGDRAYVVTGSAKPYGEYPIKTSFKVNKCFGYVEEENEYELNPPIRPQCPYPEEEVSVSGLPDVCYDFVQGLSRCQVPKVGTNRDGDRTVDGQTGIPKSCTNFVLPQLNYASCYDRHVSDPDFLTDEWRIFLGQRWEMWDSRREIITLYDNLGQVVDQLTY